MTFKLTCTCLASIILFNFSLLNSRAVLSQTGQKMRCFASVVLLLLYIAENGALITVSPFRSNLIGFEKLSCKDYLLSLYLKAQDQNSWKVHKKGIPHQLEEDFRWKLEYWAISYMIFSDFSCRIGICNFWNDPLSEFEGQTVLGHLGLSPPACFGSNNRGFKPFITAKTGRTAFAPGAWRLAALCFRPCYH